MNKDNIKTIFTILISALVSGLVSVAASGRLFDSNEVVYDNSQNDIQSSNVKGAVDELYAAATDYSNINSRLTKLETRFSANNSTYFNDEKIQINATTQASDKGLQIFDANNKIRSEIILGAQASTTIIAAFDETGTWGNFGSLSLMGNNIAIGNGNNTANVTVNGKKVLTTDIGTFTFSPNASVVRSVNMTNGVKVNNVCILNLKMEINALSEWKDYLLGTVNVTSKAQSFSVYSPQGSSGHNAGDLYIGSESNQVYINPRSHVFSAIEWVRGQIVFPCV